MSDGAMTIFLLARFNTRLQRAQRAVLLKTSGVLQDTNSRRTIAHRVFHT